jgi:hypothetical protein
MCILPNPPASTYTITGKPTFVQSCTNAYNTAFNQETIGFNGNYQEALYNYQSFKWSDVNSNFRPGTFGYDERYNNLQSNTFFTINSLQDNLNVYQGIEYGL